MSRGPIQPSFDDISPALSDTALCVVDLETTGTSPTSSITEIGAVRARGGERDGTFQTLVRPDEPIGPRVAELTGITNRMVKTAPRIDAVLEPFLSFAKSTVLIAHNASFDVGFLRRACQAIDIEWPAFTVIDTVALARKTLVKGEVPNVKLATLARHFRVPTRPTHRALDDALATLDVFYALLERVGNRGVESLDDLQAFMSAASPAQQMKRHWANRLPPHPGVYWFKTAKDVLYVGTSKNLRQRTQTYFSQSETRSRMQEMVKIAQSLEHVRTATELEASVRELRMIAAHRPHYNQRSKRQTALGWLTLGDEPFPNIRAVPKLTQAGPTWGPFSSLSAAKEAQAALAELINVRTCTSKISRTKPSAPCALLELNRCVGPCVNKDAATYQRVIDRITQVWGGDLSAITDSASPALIALVNERRYEQAAQLTHAVRTVCKASRNYHRVASVTSCAQILACAPAKDGWDVHLIRHGRLAGAAFAPDRSSVWAEAQAVVATGEYVAAPDPGQRAASLEESSLIARWLEIPGLRILDIDGTWAWPIRSVIPVDQLAKTLLAAS